MTVPHSLDGTGGLAGAGQAEGTLSRFGNRRFAYRPYATAPAAVGLEPVPRGDARIPFTEACRRAKVALMKSVFSSATRSHSDIIPNWVDIQTWIIP
jgi:hypothetical protein